MRWKRKRNTEWHWWLAWRPVRTQSGTWVWWERVRRREILGRGVWDEPALVYEYHEVA